MKALQREANVWFVLLLNELTHFCDAAIFYFFGIVYAFKKVPAEWRVEEEIEVLRINQAFHDL